MAYLSSWSYVDSNCVVDHHHLLFIKQLHKSVTGDTMWTGPTRLVQRLQWP